jgi:hypothetical protein
MRKPSIAAIALGALFVAGILTSCNDHKTNPTVGELGGSVPGAGSQYAHMFNTAGTFHYKCTIHPSCTSLQGTVFVVPVSTPIENDVAAISFTGGSVSTCSSLSVQIDSVHVGETVTWTNNSPLPHTVTSF